MFNMTTLTSIVEVSNVFSIIIVFFVFFIMVVFILRLHGEDFRMSTGSSVTYMSQMPVQQTPMIQIFNPFIFKLIETDQTSTNINVTVTISSQCPWILHVMWGVNISDFHTQLSLSWNSMKEQILSRNFLASSSMHQGFLEHYSSCSDLKVSVSPPVTFEHSHLGISPRVKYPLIVILLRDEEQSQDSHELGALINIVHIRDTVFTMPSCVMSQYLKMADGQVTTLKPLYVVNNEEGLQERPEEQSSATLCVVCQSEVVTRALLPCRHVCTCRGCFSRLSKCPMCRSHIYSYFCIREEVEDMNRAAEADEAVEPVGWRRRYEQWNEWLAHVFTPN